MHTVKIETLTPLWTGDSKRSGKNLRETGIIGSLRWWYEILVRSLGGYVCDPTSGKCKKDKKRCEVCELFGCTGWGRKFKLEINTREEDIEYIDGINVYSQRKKRGKKQKRPFSGIATKNNRYITLNFIPLKEVSYVELRRLKCTLKFIAEYGALGGRISQGNGVIRIVNNSSENLDYFRVKNSGRNGQSVYSLENFVIWKFKISFTAAVEDLLKEKAFPLIDDKNYAEMKEVWNNCHMLPIGFHVRDAIRPVVKNHHNNHYDLVGKGGGGSRIFVSHGYQNDEDESMEFRVFGFFEKGEEEVCEEIKNCISNWLWKYGAEKDGDLPCEEIKKCISNWLSAYLVAHEKGFDIKEINPISKETGREIIERGII